MITRLDVHYCGWGETWPVGTLVMAEGRILFEYSEQAIKRGIQFSALHAPLPKPGSAGRSYSGPAWFEGLPGFIADSLPDGWGMLLMDRALRKAGRDPARVSVLERLAIIGSSAIGALVFEPADPLEAEQARIVDIGALAREMQSVAADDGTRSSSAQLRRLLLLGGSAQGTRPKALLRWRRDVNVFSPDDAGQEAGEPWLIKFPAQREHMEVCAVEAFYARLAREGGMDVPETRHLALGARHAAFGARRFDRAAFSGVPEEAEVKVPVLSLAALLHSDFRLPALDYETVLLATTRLTGDYRETLKAFDRCIFNVLTRNRDDHAKNFAYCLNREGHWKLSPAFDLTFSDGPGGQHSPSIAGEGLLPSRDSLLQVAQRGGVRRNDALRRIDHWLDVLQPRPSLLDDLPIRRTTLQAMRKAIEPVWLAVRGA